MSISYLLPSLQNTTQQSGQQKPDGGHRQAPLPALLTFQLCSMLQLQGCTVQKAVVCLDDKFFASGQAYVALSRVRTLSDLVLWQFDPSAIYLEPFYQQLLK